MPRRRQGRHHLVGADPRLVVVRHHDDLGLRPPDDVRQRRRHLPPPVEHRLGRLVPAVDALAGDAVVLGCVPTDQSLPDVVVGEVPVLVVGRVEVGEIDVWQDVDGLPDVAEDRDAGAGQELGPAQFQVVVRPRRPLLEVGHLDARRGVDPVGRQHQRGQQDREQRATPVLLLEAVPDGVDPAAVLRGEEPGRLAEGPGEVAGLRRQGSEAPERVGQLLLVDLHGVRGDPALSHDVRVRGDVHGGDVDAAPLELLRHPRRPREQIDGRPGPDRRRDVPEHGHQHALGSQVLDQDASPVSCQQGGTAGTERQRCHPAGVPPEPGRVR